MQQRYYEFCKHEQDICPTCNTKRAFNELFAEALLMALLNRGLLTQYQFELCLEKSQRSKDVMEEPI